MTTNNKTLKYAVEKQLIPLVEYVLSKPEKVTNLDECLSLAIDNNVNEKIIELLIKELKVPKEEPFEIKKVDNIIYGMYYVRDHSNFVYDLHFNRDIVWKKFQNGKYCDKALTYVTECKNNTLHYLATYAEMIEGGLEMLKILMDKIDINSKNTYGFTPLMYANNQFNGGKPISKITELLLKHPKIDLGIKSVTNMNALERFVSTYPNGINDEEWMKCFNMFLEHPQTNLFEINETMKYSIYESMFAIKLAKSKAIELLKTKKYPFSLKKDMPRLLTNTNLLIELIKAYTEHYPECLLA